MTAIPTTKNLIVIFFFSLVFVACKKEPEKPLKPNEQIADTNRWATVWQNESYTLTGISFPNKDTGYVSAFKDSTTNQIILTTYNGGKTWLFINCNLGLDTAYIPNIKAAGENCLYFLNNGNIYKSFNGGADWNILFNGNSGNNNSINDYIVFDNSNLILSSWGGVYITYDGGITWQNISIAKYNLYYPYFISKNIGYIYAYASGVNNNIYSYVYKTIDGGNTWRYFSKCVTTWPIQMQFFNDKIGFISNFIGINKTSDEGNSWQQIYKTNNYSVLSINFLNPDTGYYYDYYKIYFTTDGTKTWKTDFTNTGQPVYVRIVDWSFVKTGEAYAITSDGRIIKKMY